EHRPRDQLRGYRREQDAIAKMPGGKKDAGNRTGAEYGPMVVGVGAKARPEVHHRKLGDARTKLDARRENLPQALRGVLLVKTHQLEGAPDQESPVAALD